MIRLSEVDVIVLKKRNLKAIVVRTDNTDERTRFV